MLDELSIASNNHHDPEQQCQEEANGSVEGNSSNKRRKSMEMESDAEENGEACPCIIVEDEDEHHVEVAKTNKGKEIMISKEETHHNVLDSDGIKSDLHEIDPLVDNTMSSLRDGHDTESGDNAGDQKEPVSSNTNASDYYMMLANSNALTGNPNRDKWLEKLLEGLYFVCNNKNPNTDLAVWPYDAVSAVNELERASYESICTHQKYNQKMRQLCFNIKNNEKLAWRILKRELKPWQILAMEPNELKEGLTAEEMSSNKPEEDVLVPMTDARCERCTEKKVCLVEIISAGTLDRYKLECTVCGKKWYASRDEGSTFVILSPRTDLVS